MAECAISEAAVEGFFIALGAFFCLAIVVAAGFGLVRYIRSRYG